MNKDFENTWDTPVTVRTESAPSSSSSTPKAGVKQIVTIRLDVDMLDWFKAEGPGYQTRINQVLREHMEAKKAKAS